MSLSKIATVALAVISSAAIAGHHSDAGCGAGACAKKKIEKDAECGAGACAKKDMSSDKKEAACGSGACAKKDAHCGKK